MLKNIWDWFLWFTGVTNAGWAAWWGGFFSCLPLFGVFAVVWRRMECHAPGCHRIGLHRTADGLYVLCRKHHPDVPDKLTLEAIHQSHAAAKARKEGKKDT